MRAVAMDPWRPALQEETFTPESLALQRRVFEAWEHADVEWILEHAHPDLEIRQPAELTDARLYRGREGFLDAILDWPTQWDDFGFEPRRIFAIDAEHVGVLAVHRGRSRHFRAELEAELAWLFRWRGDVLIRWDMFMNVDDAVAAVTDATD